MANIDRTLHGRTPDHRISLTKRGEKQAFKAGVKLNSELYLGRGIEILPIRYRVKFYTSPYMRTRQTCQGIVAGLRDSGELPIDVSTYEDPRLREQEFGNYRPPGSYSSIQDERDSFGTFFYRVPGGESGADVFDRLSGAMDTMHRDFSKRDFPDNMIVVSHGLTIRLFLMKWFHWTVEEFEKLRNPRNCQYYILDKMSDEKYRLMTDVARYTEQETHEYLAGTKEGITVDLTSADDEQSTGEGERPGWSPAPVVG